MSIGYSNSAAYHDPGLVESLWEKIIDKELSDSIIKPVAVQKLQLINKIETLAKLYMPSEKYFPTGTCVQVN